MDLKLARVWLGFETALEFEFVSVADDFVSVGEESQYGE